MASTYGTSKFDAGKEETRFQPLLDSDSTLGQDLSNLFDQLRHRTHGYSPVEELSADIPFKLGPAGLGFIAGMVEKRPQH